VPLEESAVKNYDRFLSQPVGNGSFRIAQPWSGTGPVLLERFDRALNEPEIDGIRFVPYPDAANSWLPFLEGDLDVAEVPFGRIQSAREQFGDRGYVPQLNGAYFGLDVKSKQLKDVRLRVAISRAIDREAIAKNVFKGTLAPPRGAVPRGMPGFGQDICERLCTYSPKAARRLVRQLPRKGRKVSIAYNKDPVQKRAVAIVERNLEDIGIKVNVNAYPFQKYLQLLSDNDLRMYRLGWIAEYPSPDVFMSSLFASGSADNHSGFSSKRVDKLLSKAHRETSPAKRERLYLTAERLVLQKMPVVPVGSFVMRWAAQDWVKDIDFDVTGGFDAAPVSIEGR
jgi:peptide/nickel transport system substrate-binding protein/oligopeptide transport system substrate-binding protein